MDSAFVQEDGGLARARAFQDGVGERGGHGDDAVGLDHGHAAAAEVAEMKREGRAGEVIRRILPDEMRGAVIGEPGGALAAVPGGRLAVREADE